MVPVWSLVLVLVVGVVVGAGLGLLWRRRAAGSAPSPQVTEPKPPIAAPEEATTELEAAISEEPAALGGLEPPPVVAASQAAPAPVVAPKPAAPAPAPSAEGPGSEGRDEPGAEPPVGAAVPTEPVAGPLQGTLDLEAGAATRNNPEAEAREEEGGLDARMDGVLSELERRYRGRRVASDEAGGPDGGPDAARGPRRPRS